MNEPLKTEEGCAPQLAIEGHVATITLSRPALANRLSPGDLTTLREHVASVNDNAEIRVLRLISTGKYFCSGYDISSLASDQAPSSLFFGETVDILEAARPVTIALIQGGVYGGGTDMVLACDFRIGSDQSNMFMPATRLGLHFYPGGMRRYVTRLGLNQAKRLFLTAEKIDAPEMLRIGFLTELVATEKLHARLEELTQTLLEMAPLALFGVKEHLNRIAAGELDVTAIQANVKRTENSEDIVEGARAWKEKRKPSFKGR
jgi:enoyl-CoA hydratase